MKSHAQTVFLQFDDGCFANMAEASRLKKFFEENGYDVVGDPEHADLIVYNTCAFDRPREDTSMRGVGELQDRLRPNAELLVTGCLPAVNAKRLKEQFHGRTVTPATLDRLDEMFSSRVSISEIQDAHATSGESRIIQVATGCMGECSFCGIKKAIGTIRSRRPEEIIEHFTCEYRKGYRRFVFASHDIGAYGKDLGTNVIELVSDLPDFENDYQIEIEWIDPRWLDEMLDGFIMHLKTGKISQEHFVISVQSFNARILKLMKRNYSPELVENCIRELTRSVNSYLPSIEVIVGFPSEQETEFDDTKRLLQMFAYRKVLAYGFDPKPGTVASTMPGQLAPEVIAHRFRIAHGLIQENQAVSIF